MLAPSKLVVRPLTASKGRRWMGFKIDLVKLSIRSYTPKRHRRLEEVGRKATGRRLQLADLE